MWMRDMDDIHVSIRLRHLHGSKDGNYEMEQQAEQTTSDANVDIVLQPVWTRWQQREKMHSAMSCDGVREL